MADTTSASAAKPAKKAASKPKKPRATPSHPPVNDMIKAAVSNLKERNGSSRQAIVKYISANYKVDIEKLTPHIKKQLKNAVTKGTLIHTKGTGASGSFKLSAATKKPEKKVKKPAAKKPKTAAKKTTPKKPKAKPKAAGEKKPKAKKAAKSPAKKAAKKSPAKKAAKPKKPKATKSPKKKAAKK